jgi:hypothetical protein
VKKITRESCLHARGTGLKSCWLVVGLTLVACGPPDVEESANNCDGACQAFGPRFPEVGECQQGACTPTFHECFHKSEHSTCQSYCASIGSTCAENACAGGTYLIHAVVEWCEDPTKEGVLIEHGCAEPIDWQVNEAAQCCCEQ